MKKRIILVAVMVLLVPSILMADIMQLGVNVGYGLNYQDLTDDVKDDYFALENFNLAPELRFNIFFLQLDAVSALSFGNDFFAADTQATLGVQFKLFNAVRLGAGAGISVPIVSRGGNWTIGDPGQPLEDFADAMANSRMLYKVSVGIPISSFEITANWMIPAEGTFNTKEFMPDIQKSTFSLGFLLTLF